MSTNENITSLLENTIKIKAKTAVISGKPEKKSI